MCPTFLYCFLLVPFLFQKKSKLLASLFDRNRNSHTDHGVVTCADEFHHLYASGAFAIASGCLLARAFLRCVQLLRY